jgi:type I site-specific restriction endonuclease
VDTDHASRLRQAIANENADLVKQNPKYVMRITGDDTEGVDQLSNFIDPESKYPVIVTTSRLLSTGVDAQTCRLIVLDREVGSMTEFKQIVGRGTRMHDDTGARNRHCEGRFVPAMAARSLPSGDEAISRREDELCGCKWGCGALNIGS